MQDLDSLFKALDKSDFRRRFRLGKRERAYLHTKGMEEILRHAHDFIDQRLALAQPRNDGKQTPMRGHPVFIAQHATASCCRGCLSKWHGIAAGQALGEREKAHILAVLSRWLEMQLRPDAE